MTQPPEYLQTRTETQALSDALVQALERIRRAWPEMLPSSAPGRRVSPGSGASAGIASTHGGPDHVNARGALAWHADHVANEGDVDALTRVLSLRSLVTARLNAWCRLVMEERPVTNPASLPVGDNAMAMCAFLERQADWLSGHEDAPFALEELTDDARSCERWTDPYRKEWHTLGACPFVLDDGETVTRFCRGRVRVFIADDTDEATCSDCHRAGTIPWWELVLGKVSHRVVSPAEAAVLLAAHFGLDVNERTVRRWAASGRIRRLVGPLARKPQYWFDERALLDDVARMDRECVLCGSIHSGGSQLCLRCLSSTRLNTPRYAEQRVSVATGAVPVKVRRPTAITPNGLHTLANQIQQRCKTSDLPTAWCACGRHAC